MVFLWLIVTWFIVEVLIRNFFKVQSKGSIKNEQLSKRYEKYLSILLIVLISLKFFFQFPIETNILIWIYLTILWFFRGVQEWKYDKENKQFIVSWAGSSFSLIIASLSLIGIV